MRSIGSTKVFIVVSDKINDLHVKLFMESLGFCLLDLQLCSSVSTLYLFVLRHFYKKKKLFVGVL